MGTSAHVGRWAVVAILFGTYVMLKFYVPRRIAFALSRPAFQQFVAKEATPLSERTILNKTLGAYLVDEYASDQRGGMYFRVCSGNDGLGPDTMSYGFVYRPNAEGSPFGAARYRVFRLSDDWYWFRASDDWY